MKFKHAGQFGGMHFFTVEARQWCDFTGPAAARYPRPDLTVIAAARRQDHHPRASEMLIEGEFTKR